MKEAAKKAVRDLAPQWGNGRGLTGRDASTLTLAGSVQVILYWVLHDMAKVEIPPEVAGALSSLVMFWVARKTRY